VADSAAADSVVGRARLAPSGPLAPFVEYYWIARWDLRGQPSYEQTILPHPDVHLVFEASGAGIYGVDRSPFARRLSGQGKAVGVRFRAGCFRPFWEAPISQLSDRVTPATRLFGPLAEKTRQAIMCAETDADMASHAESLLFSGLPEPDPVAEQVAGLVALITSDASLRRVDQLSAVSGLSTRGLQRNFADYVGVSPKWVMRWARLHEAAARADRGEPVDWSGLAVDLGYADQAHLTRDFTVTLGVPPSRYAAALLRHRAVSSGRDSAQVWPWTAAFECLPDFCYNGGRLFPDLLRREGQHDDAVFAHAALPLERPSVVLRRHVPLARIDLDGDAELRPPCVGRGYECVTCEYRRVEERHRQPRPGQQVLEISFGGGPDPDRDVSERLTEQCRACARTGVKFGNELRHLAPLSLHGIGYDRPHVAQASQAAYRVRDRARSEGVPDRAERIDAPGHPAGPVQPREARILALSRQRNQDVHQL
jgi:AraC-like DNA-binding protein